MITETSSNMVTSECSALVHAGHVVCDTGKGLRSGIHKFWFGHKEYFNVSRQTNNQNRDSSVAFCYYIKSWYQTLFRNNDLLDMLCTPKMLFQVRILDVQTFHWGNADIHVPQQWHQLLQLNLEKSPLELSIIRFNKTMHTNTFHRRKCMMFFHMLFFMLLRLRK